MIESDVIEGSEQNGLEDGATGAPYSPLLVWGISDDAAEAYVSAYWHAVAYPRLGMS